VTHQSGAQHGRVPAAGVLRGGRPGGNRRLYRGHGCGYAEADLVVCRAGATTVAEIAVAGVASILVPFPHAVDDHQTVNARFLADAEQQSLLRKMS